MHKTSFSLWHRTSKFKQHPGWDFRLFLSGFDIVLLDMRESGIELTPRISPVCRPTMPVQPEDIVQIMGWGITDSPPTAESNVSPFLKKVNKQTIPLFENKEM